MVRLFGLSLYASLLAACGDAPPPPQTAAERVSARIEQIATENRLREEEDKRNAPFDSKLDVASLSRADKVNLCGADYGKIVIGWPIKKALACGSHDLHVVSEAAGGFRVWQYCSGSGHCVTIGEAGGRVNNWNSN